MIANPYAETPGARTPYMSHWTDAIIGERMAVDGQFSDRVAASEFTNAEWELIMTATDLDMEHPDDPDAARIVADTDDVETIIPELDAIRAQTAAMAGQPGGGSRDSTGGGVVESIMSALGFGTESADDEVDQAKLAAAEKLTQEYAEALQTHLEATDSFEQARAAYLDANQE